MFAVLALVQFIDQYYDFWQTGEGTGGSTPPVRQPRVPTRGH